MKNFFIVILLFCLVILSGCEKQQNLSFDVDINSLSYQLPSYDKLCIPEAKIACSNNECKSIKPTVFVLYDSVSNKVYRCDKIWCDWYDSISSVSSIYDTIQPIEPKWFFVKIEKIENQRKDNYIEVVTLLLDTLISKWTCSNI